ncbi:MAG: hypothetical protein J5879_10225, partial [Clostridia bacterium]|nr:hypothetical protein [Clostridia bacterium]
MTLLELRIQNSELRIKVSHRDKYGRFPPLKLGFAENPPYPPFPSGTPVALKFATGNPPVP